MNLPILYKKDSKGKIQYWEIETDICVVDKEAKYIIVRHGKEGGKEQITSDTITQGKNIGKANETSAHEQADLEAKSKWTKQIERKGYVANKALLDTDQRPGAEPMLAHKYAVIIEGVLEYESASSSMNFPCYIQPKLDGHRCIAVVKDGKCELFSRQRKPITSLPHIIEAIEASGIKEATLDGELFSDDINTSNIPRIPWTVMQTKDDKMQICQEDVPKLEGRTPVVNTAGYAVVRIEQENYYVHRLVMDAEEGQFVDHKNGNKLDNRRENLRFSTMSENIANTTKRVSNTSGYKGVHFFKRDSNWQAQITYQTKKIHLGYFDTVEEAAKVYDKKAYELFGEFAILNFPKTLLTFETLTGYIRSKEPKEGCEVVQYHIYDYIDSVSPFDRRSNILLDILPETSPFLKIVDTRKISDEEEAMIVFRFFRSQGYEGAILRNIDSLYEGVRSYNLQKFKEFDDAEFLIVGIKEGRGKMKGHAIFICEVDEDETVDVKMRGSMETLKEIFENQDAYIGRDLTVAYQGVTKNGIPRFPVGLRLREDV